jgi:PQQ-like domain
VSRVSQPARGWERKRGIAGCRRTAAGGGHTGYGPGWAPAAWGGFKENWAYSAHSIAAAGILAAGNAVYNGALGVIVVALGARKWEYVQAGSGLHGIALAGHVLYVGASNDQVYALRDDSGAVIWSFSANGPDVIGNRRGGRHRVCGQR